MTPVCLTSRSATALAPADVGADPVAGLEHEVAADRRPALVHHRLDGDDALGVGHLADAAVLGERVLDDELLVGDRLVVGEDGDLTEHGSVLASSVPPKRKRAHQMGGWIDPCLHLGVALIRADGNVIHLVDKAINTFLLGPRNGSLIAKFTAIILGRIT